VKIFQKCLNIGQNCWKLVKKDQKRIKSDRKLVEIGKVRKNRLAKIDQAYLKFILKNGSKFVAIWSVSQKWSKLVQKLIQSLQVYWSILVETGQKVVKNGRKLVQIGNVQKYLKIG
jgi:hypothetical protein